MFTLKAVIFDHTTLLLNDQNLQDQVAVLLANLRERGLSIVVFSTHSFDIDLALSTRGLEPPDLFVTSQMVGKNKQHPEWAQYVCETLGLSRQHLLYVGDDQQDYLTAIQGGVLYLHAAWSKMGDKTKKIIRVNEPNQVLIFAEQFLLVPPRWEFMLDVESHKVLMRSLIYADTTLPATTIDRFSLLQVLKPSDPELPEVKNVAAYVVALLVLHALTSLHVEGILNQGAFFTIYPSSTPNESNPVLRKFLLASAALFGGYYRQSVLERFKQGVDTSVARTEARRRGDRFDNNIYYQTNTVRVNPASKAGVKGRQVVLFDDFITTGTSVEWGRNLLYAAGAEQVIIVSIGKYPTSYKMHVPTGNATIKPFEEIEYPHNTFSIIEKSVVRDTSARLRLENLFRDWKSQQGERPTHDTYIDEW